jgi:SRSO17 transposase
VVLADAGYGDCMEFRQELRKRALPYVLGILSTIVVWRPGEGPEPPSVPSEKKLGRPRTKWQTGKAKPVSVLGLGLERGRRALHTVRWREGSRGRQKSQFGFERVRTAHGHTKGHAPGHEQWLIYEWPKGEPEPTKFWLADLPKGTSQRKLVRLAKLRWRVERDYQDMKGEVGLDHFEGRTWRGFHHHAVLCAVAHAFLALQRARFRRGNHPLLRTLGAVKRFLQMVLLCILGDCPTCGRRVSALSLPAAPSRI